MLLPVREKKNIDLNVKQMQMYVLLSEMAVKCARLMLKSLFQIESPERME